MPHLMTFNHTLFGILYLYGIYRGYFIDNGLVNGLTDGYSDGSEMAAGNGTLIPELDTRITGHSIFEALAFIPAVIFLWQSCRYMSAAFYFAIPFINLSTLYLNMSFNQVIS